MQMGIGIRLDATQAWNRIQLGPELINNGGFDSVTTGWTPNANVGLSIDAGRLRVESNTDTPGGKYAYQIVTVEAMASYQLQMELVDESETAGVLRVGTTIAGFDLFNNGVLGLKKTTIMPMVTSIYVTALIGNTSLNGEGALFDNFSLKKIL